MARLGAIEVNFFKRKERRRVELDDNGELVGRRYRLKVKCGKRASEGGGFGEATAQTRYPVKIEYNVIGSELPSVHRRLVVPVNALADVKDNGQEVWPLVALRQVWCSNFYWIKV